MNVALRRFWIQLTADKRRFGVLLTAIAVGLLMWARVIIVSRPPRMAVADDAAAASARADAETHTPAPISEPLKPPLAINLLFAPPRDPFRINPKFFPKPTPVDDGTGDPAKSGPKLVDSASDAAAMRAQRLGTLAADFRLEAVMQGSPIAVINGRTMRPGDTIAAPKEPATLFTLREVGPRWVVLECEDVAFEVRMPDVLDLPG